MNLVPPPPFDPTAFLLGFAEHLKARRGSELGYLARIASPEAWLQFEAVAWLHLNRGAVGLHPNAHVSAEKDKTDIWIAARDGSGAPTGAAIETKMIHNNKNWSNQLADLRRDLSPAKKLPGGYSAANTTRFGLATLVYVEYLPESSGGYTHRFESSEAFLAAYTQARSAAGTAPRLEVVGQLVQVLELDDQPYLKPGGGSAVWSLCAQLWMGDEGRS